MVTSMAEQDGDWTKPRATAIPKGQANLQKGKYGPIYPRTAANYGFSVIGKLKPGREQAVRDYGKTIEGAIEANPSLLAPLKLHYLRWVLFDIANETYFMYQGIFDTDFDTYLDDAISLFTQTGVTTVFTHLEGFPEDWKTNVPAVAKFFHEHQNQSFLEYGEYPYATTDEIKKALRLKKSFAEALDQMQ